MFKNTAKITIVFAMLGCGVLVQARQIQFKSKTPVNITLVWDIDNTQLAQQNEEIKAQAKEIETANKELQQILANGVPREQRKRYNQLNKIVNEWSALSQKWLEDTKAFGLLNPREQQIFVATNGETTVDMPEQAKGIDEITITEPSTNKKSRFIFSATPKAQQEKSTKMVKYHYAPGWGTLEKISPRYSIDRVSIITIGKFYTLTTADGDDLSSPN